MWDINTYWFDFAMVSLIYAIGNILFGHFEDHTPKWRRVLKYVLSLVLVIGLAHFTNRYVAYGLIGLVALFVFYVHAIALPKKGINGWTGKPKEKYYEFRGWDKKLKNKSDTNSKMKHMVVRQGQHNDITEMQKLFVDTVTTICKADYDSDQISEWISGVDNKQRWDDILTKQFILVALYADKIVGYATLDNGNYIDFFYVHKDHQRQGIAQRLFEEITNEAKRLKQTTLTSDVSKTARPFFEKNDFKVLTEQTVKM